MEPNLIQQDKRKLKGNIRQKQKNLALSKKTNSPAFFNPH